MFYGWRLVAAASVIQFLHGGLLIQAFGAYVAVLSSDLGWSKTALSVGAAILAVEGAVLGPALGWIVDRFGARSVVQAGMVCLGLGFIALSQIDTVAGFYVAMVLLALGTSLGGYFPLTVTLVHWFRRQRARALSILSLGIAVGGVAVPLVAGAMQAFGWRATAFGSGLLAMAVGIPLARMLRRHPSEVGETVDGRPPDAPDTVIDGVAASPQRNFTAAEALQTRAFWLLAFGHGIALMVVGAVNVHAISHIVEGLHYSVAQASLVITLMTVAQVGGVLTGAAFGDRWDKRLAAAGCMVLHMVGLLLLTFASGNLMLGAFALFHGFAWGLRGPFMQALRADYFGLQAIGMILGLSALLIAGGQVIGPMLAGGLKDLAGDYRVGFSIIALVAGAGSILFLMAKKPT